MAELPLVVAPNLIIPGEELELRASRSSGPGGQHVNTSSTRIELRWNVGTSTALRPADRDWLLGRLGSRLDGEGWLRVVSQTARSQLQNRQAARARLAELVAAALARPTPRRATKPTAASEVRREQAKRHRSARKADRRKPPED